MNDDQKQRRVVLIYGDPGNGKSYLADRLHTIYGYHLLKLDEAYVDFVQTQFPDLYLPAINHVIAQHYQTILVPCDRARITPGAIFAWQNHVISLAMQATHEHQHVAVEGFLLAPVLDSVQERLIGAAIVTAVNVRDRQYFVYEGAKTIEQIHGG